MTDSEFKNAMVFISRNDAADILSEKIVDIHVGLVDKMGDNVDDELVSLIDEMLMHFSAEILTEMFDKDREETNS